MSLNAIGQDSALSYCQKERDQAEKTLDICDKSLQSCEEVNTDLQSQLTIGNNISKEQTAEIVSQKTEIDDLKKSNTTGKIIFGVIGLAFGLAFGIPLLLILGKGV